MATLDSRARILAGASGGLAIAWAGLSLLRPVLDQDSAYYHLPTVVNWISDGSPGSIHVVSAAFPTGNYPVTNEVVLGWIGAISHNMGFLLLWPVACAGLLAASIWLALRSLSCPRWASAGGIAAVLLIPIVARTVSSLDTDLASITWLSVCIALCVAPEPAKGAPRSSLSQPSRSASRSARRRRWRRPGSLHWSLPSSRHRVALGS